MRQELACKGMLKATLIAHDAQVPARVRPACQGVLGEHQARPHVRSVSGQCADLLGEWGSLDITVACDVFCQCADLLGGACGWRQAGSTRSREY